MKLHYNSPVVLTFVFITAILLFLKTVLLQDWIDVLFSVCGMDYMSWANPLTYFRLVSHALGHANLMHLAGNLMLILLIGPILEEKYGSRDLFIMMLVTALVTGLLQSFLFRGECLMGASGIVFFMIILASITNFRRGSIPLTFILVVALYLGQEVYQALSTDQISQFAHIIGGISGGIFGFLFEGKKVSGDAQ